MMNKKTLLCYFAGALLSLAAHSQKIRYQVAAPNAVHHEAEITVIADGLPASPALFQMSRSSPGRYAKHEFGKNVYNVAAYDATGKTLPVEKADADVYRVSGHKGTVKLVYTLFGNYPDGTYAGIDVTGYHLNMPASFIWVKGLEKAPITIQFAVPDKNWKVATQLKPTDDPYTFTAPNLQYFMDAPTKVGNLHMRTWKVTNTDGRQLTFRLALEAQASEQLVDSFTEKLKKVVQAGKEVYGEFPSYDYGTYTFLASINPYVRGDGMEHRNSTMITIPANFDGSNELLSVFAHEFFHCWNVERIRPKSLEPFNFEKSNMSEALWVAEGFTHYYGDVLMARAGLIDYSDFGNEMSKLVNAKVNTPGAQYYTPIESSERAVFTDAGVSIDQTNYPNMFTSYYPYGGALALALDLELRSRYNKSMDDVMQALWKKHGKTEISYIIPDVQNALSTATGDAAYAADFFKKYVYGHESIDYKTLFSTAGFVVKPVIAGKAWLGRASFRNTDNGVIIAGNTVRNTPLYIAGADINDVISELDGVNIKMPNQIEEVLKTHKPGDKITITYVHHNIPTKTSVTLMEDPSLQVVSNNHQNITDKQQQLRKAWVGSKQ